MSKKWLVGLATVVYSVLCGLVGVFYLHFSFWKSSYTQLAGYAMLFLSIVLLLAFFIRLLHPNRLCLWILVICAVLLLMILFSACLCWLSFLGAPYYICGVTKFLSLEGVLFQAAVIILGVFVAKGNI